MSGLVGRGSRSFKKKSVAQSLIPALGIKKVRFAHRAPAGIMPDGNGEITISFATFIAPPEMVAEGFSNPSSTEITNLRVGQFRNNVRIESNLNGVLIDQITYTITDSSFTLMDGYIVTAGEIFVFTVGSNPVTGNRIVDARPLRASGDVDFSMIGTEVVNFEVGQGFRVAGSTINSLGEDNQQIGNVQVFVDGVLQFRNNGNGDEDSMAAAMQTGNYREIALSPTGTIITGVDYANAVRFNMGQPFSSTEGVLVVATNLIVDEPNGTGLISIVDNNTANIASNVTNIATNATNISANTTAINDITGFLPLYSQSAEELGPVPPNTSAGQAGASILRQWTCPPDVEVVFVEMAAGGSSGETDVSSGGGAGSYYQGHLKVVPGQTYLLEIGQGGDRANNTGGNRTGSRSRFEGSSTALINNNASAFVNCTGGAGVVSNTIAPGTTTASPTSILGTTFTETSGGLNGGSVLYSTPTVNSFNVDGLWRSGTSGDSAGGSTAKASGGSGASNDGGGGAGWTIGEVGNTGPGGRGGSGGSGGMRISWYTEEAASSAANFPITTR